MISEKVQDALNKQIQEELGSAYLYFAMAADFEAKNLKGFSAWMKAQAGEEMIHATKFYNFINERGGRATLLALEQPQAVWDLPIDAFKAAYKHEQFISNCINNLVKLAREESDTATEIMLQWFVTEQVEEEASADEIVQQLEMVQESKGGMFMLDRELGNRALPALGAEVSGISAGE